MTRATPASGRSRLPGIRCVLIRIRATIQSAKHASPGGPSRTPPMADTPHHTNQGGRLHDHGAVCLHRILHRSPRRQCPSLVFKRTDTCTSIGLRKTHTRTTRTISGESKRKKISTESTGNSMARTQVAISENTEEFKGETYKQDLQRLKRLLPIPIPSFLVHQTLLRCSFSRSHFLQRYSPLSPKGAPSWRGTRIHRA